MVILQHALQRVEKRKGLKAAPVGEHVVLVEVVAGVGHAEVVGDVNHHLTQRHALFHDALATHEV